MILLASLMVVDGDSSVLIFVQPHSVWNEFYPSDHETLVSRSREYVLDHTGWGEWWKSTRIALYAYLSCHIPLPECMTPLHHRPWFLVYMSVFLTEIDRVNDRNHWGWFCTQSHTGVSQCDIVCLDCISFHHESLVSRSPDHTRNATESGL